MRIAIPLADGRLAMHFGHCEQFAIVDVDEAAKEINQASLKPAPPHEPGLLPRWLHQQHVDVVIAGGMGQRALGLFAEQGIRVVVGAASDTVSSVVTAYLNGTLAVGGNVCDH